MLRSVAHVLPVRVRTKLRASLTGVVAGTVSQGWDEYAKRYKAEPGKHLGDEWNEPEIIGIDVAPDEMVATLDRRVFQPFLGACDTLLEIGSGGGRFTEILIPKCKRLIASDTSSHMLSLLKERLGDRPALECLLLDGQGLRPIENESIDAAFSFDVFVHLQQWDIFNYLCELRRILKPGGKAVIHHANTFSELGWKRFLADTPRQLDLPKDWGTLSVMTPQIIEEFSKRAGLHLVDCVTDVVRRDCISLLQSGTGKAAGFSRGLGEIND